MNTRGVIRNVFYLITGSALYTTMHEIASAQGNNVTLLSERIPIIGQGSVVPDMTTVMNGLLGISVGFAAAMAVIMLAVGGFKYMTSDSMFKMGDAREQITNAIVGLLIVLMAVLVLSYINPEITQLRFFV